MVRSIAAIVVGFLLIGALSFGGDAVLKQIMPNAWDATGRVDSIPVLMLITAYVSTFAILGCYICARLAPNHPMRHALILGALGLAFNVFASMKMWNTAPAWWNIMSLLLVMPLAYIGGKIRENQVMSASSAGSFAQS